MWTLKLLLCQLKIIGLFTGKYLYLLPSNEKTVCCITKQLLLPPNWHSFQACIVCLFVCLSCGLVSAPLLNPLAHFSTKRPKFGGAHKGQPKGQAELRAPHPINAVQSRSPFWLPFQSSLTKKEKVRETFPPNTGMEWWQARQTTHCPAHEPQLPQDHCIPWDDSQ